MSRKARIFIEYGKKKYNKINYLNLMKQFDNNYGFPVEVKEKTK